MAYLLPTHEELTLNPSQLCLADTPSSSELSSRIRTVETGFSATPDHHTNILSLPQPAYRTGAHWVVAVGCPGCTFRLGINITRCGDGWAGFPSSDLVLSPSQAASSTPEQLLELAGFNFTCVPLISAKVRDTPPPPPRGLPPLSFPFIRAIAGI